jgi:hypothetical protein
MSMTLRPGSGNSRHADLLTPWTMIADGGTGSRLVAMSAKSIKFADGRILSAETVVDEASGQVTGVRFLLDDEEIPEAEGRKMVGDWQRGLTPGEVIEG